MARSIREEIIYNTTQEKYDAFVDYGNVILQHSENIASETLVFILVGLKYGITWLAFFWQMIVMQICKHP